MSRRLGVGEAELDEWMSPYFEGDLAWIGAHPHPVLTPFGHHVLAAIAPLMSRIDLPDSPMGWTIRELSRFYATHPKAPQTLCTLMPRRQTDVWDTALANYNGGGYGPQGLMIEEGSWMSLYVAYHDRASPPQRVLDMLAKEILATPSNYHYVLAYLETLYRSERVRPPAMTPHAELLPIVQRMEESDPRFAAFRFLAARYRYRVKPRSVSGRELGSRFFEARVVSRRYRDGLRDYLRGP